MHSRPCLCRAIISLSCLTRISFEGFFWANHSMYQGVNFDAQANYISCINLFCFYTWYVYVINSSHNTPSTYRSCKSQSAFKSDTRDFYLQLTMFEKQETLHTVRHVLVNIKLLLKIDNAATNQGNFTQNQTSWTTWPLASSCSVIPGSKYEILQSQTFIYSLWSQTTTIMHAIYIYIYIYIYVCVCVCVCVCV